VINAVADNCLSTLKHETMYYPSRIRQLIDTGDTASLEEVTSYYRSLYGVLTEQAVMQIERRRLHLQSLDHYILGDRVLIGYLFEILRKQAVASAYAVSYDDKDEKYVVCEVCMGAVWLSESAADTLFTPTSAAHVPFLLCRQIVRDHGEATQRHGCAIRAEVRHNETVIIITLPRIWNHSK